MKNILIIGCGYHARRIYVPHIIDHKNAKLVAILDLESQKEIIENYLNSKAVPDVDIVYTNNYEITDTLSRYEVLQLNELVERNQVDGVIISTEPLAHFKYAKWALEKRLHILMDKPITTEVNVSTDINQAKKIYKDYLFLKDLYLEKIKKGHFAFILQAQRRHHEGFIKTKNLIREMAERVNCPVTSIQGFHSDGQWRFPREIIEQDYHPYNQGYGKMSHSGYHSLDIAVWFAQSSILDKEKEFDNLEVYSQAVRPIDFFQQFTPKDYKNLFPDIPNEDIFSSGEFKKMMDSGVAINVTGEIDAHTLIALKHDNLTITSLGIHAVHNGFGQRNWISARGRDLYKGNGRVRHESYVIEQGPFQCIIVNSFQSHEIFKSEVEKSAVGGEYHYDIHVFRNNTLFPDVKAYELITMSEMRPVEENHNYSRGHQEEARRNCTEEFIASMENSLSPEKQNSNFLDHELSTQILSMIYQSLSQVDNRVVKDSIHFSK